MTAGGDAKRDDDRGDVTDVRRDAASSATASEVDDGTLPAIAFDNTYARDLAGSYVAWQPQRVPAPRLVAFNRELAHELGLDPDAWSSRAEADVWAGNRVPAGAQPLAQAYAGHQFGGFSPQLGDGRALLLGEVVDRNGQRRDIAFKGSGPTPFSRRGDGKAALGPVLREFVIGEAMHAFGIPTTRALAAATTGEVVRREEAPPGAVLTRIAASHLRVGTFEFFAARRDHAMLRRLVDYALARHDAGLVGADNPALALLQRVVERQAALVARWMGVGFIHGVMNTDNCAISGETIDYGPCAFMEAYDPNTVYSSIDTQGRYAFGRQPSIAQWNLARLAEALLAVIDDPRGERAPSTERADPAMPEPPPIRDDTLAQATAAVDRFVPLFEARVLDVMRAKFGLDGGDDATADRALVHDGLALLHAQRIDHTLGFRRLNAAAEGDAAPWLALFNEADAARAYLGRLQSRWAASATARHARAATMRTANPAYIPRNHRVEEALAAAVERDDFAPFERLLAVVRAPFDERDGGAAYADPAPLAEAERYRTFCGT